MTRKTGNGNGFSNPTPSIFKPLTDEQNKFLDEAEKRIPEMIEFVANALDGQVFDDYCKYEDAVGDELDKYDKEFITDLMKVLVGIPGEAFRFQRMIRNRLRETGRVKLEGLDS